MRIWKFFIWFVFLAACSTEETTTTDTSTLSWEEIKKVAKSQQLTLMMWQGDPFINKYMKNFIKPRFKELYDIDLEIIGGQGTKIVSVLMTEKQADLNESSMDAMWINGETFYQLRQLDALYGPFLHRLPNMKNINMESPFINTDFQQKIDGYECPWGNVQLTMIYNNKKKEHLPKNMEELEVYVQAHPGRFTFANEFTGMTLLKSWLIALAGGQEVLNGAFDETKYEEYSAKLWVYINRIKPYFWKEGKTFPATLAQLHQMFANGEVDFTMSNNDGEVDNKVLQGLFPETARSYVFETGTIQNSHYIGISKESVNKEAAMVFCNFLISEEAQYQKMNPEVWGDGTILDIEKLSAEWKEKFGNIPQRKFAPKRSEIQGKALMELAPEYMIRLSEDFRKKVIEQ